MLFYNKIKNLEEKKKMGNANSPNQLKSFLFGVTESKISKILLNSLDSVTASCNFEKLPKMILAKIFGFLNLHDISKVWILNKFFFKFLFESSIYSNFVWKSYLEESQTTGEEDIDSESLFQKSFFEKRVNKIYLFVKVGNL